MKNLIKKCLFVTGILACLPVLFACATQSSSGYPQWIESPDINQAVGRCESHALGRHKQKECALARARLELAARQGVVISAQTVLTEHATNLSTKSTLEGVTTQSVDSVIKARLVDSYHDKQRDIIWVLIEEN